MPQCASGQPPPSAVVLSALCAYPPHTHSQVSYLPPPFGSPSKRVSVQGFPSRQAPCKTFVGTSPDHFNSSLNGRGSPLYMWAVNTLGIPYPRSARNAMHYAVFTAPLAVYLPHSHAIPPLRAFPLTACLSVHYVPYMIFCRCHTAPHGAFALLSTPYRTFATHVCSMP